MKRAIAYLHRCSSDPEAEMQIRKQYYEAVNYCLVNGYKLEAVYSDIANTRIPLDRKGHMEMMKFIMKQTEPIDLILVKSKDSISPEKSWVFAFENYCSEHLQIQVVYFKLDVVNMRTDVVAHANWIIKN